MAGVEAEVFVERYGLVIGFGDSERDCLEIGLGQMAPTVPQERSSELLAAPAFRYAKLGDVGDFFGHAGTEDHAHQRSGAGVAEEP